MEVAIAMGAGGIAARIAETADPALVAWWCSRVTGAQALTDLRDGRDS